MFLALDPRLDREVALKLYRGETAGAAPDLPTGQHSLRASADLLREARLMARVKHPNVVSVHGAEHDGQRVGIWMDYIRGRTLSAVLREQGTLGAREAAIIGQDLCQALAAVHAAGVIHQDVKAQNVMREDGGRIVLMDFGVGLDVGTEAGASLFAPGGTPFYMAPETLLEGRSSPAPMSTVSACCCFIWFRARSRCWRRISRNCSRRTSWGSGGSCAIFVPICPGSSSRWSSALSHAIPTRAFGRWASSRTR